MKLLSSWKTGRTAVALGSHSPYIISPPAPLRRSRVSLLGFLDQAASLFTFTRNLINFVNRAAVSRAARCHRLSAPRTRSKLFDVLFA